MRYSVVGISVLVLALGCARTFSVVNMPLAPPPTPLEPRGFAPPEPPYKVVINGDVAKDSREVALLPIQIFSQFSEKEHDWSEKLSPEQTQFKIVLRKSGTAIYESPLYVSMCNHSPYDFCFPSDNGYGPFKHTIVNLGQLPDEVLIVHGNEPIFSAKEPAEPFPEITITKQEYTEGHVRIAWEVAGEKKLNYYGFVSNCNLGPKHETIGIGVEGTGRNSDASPIFNGDSIDLHVAGFMKGDVQLVIYASDGFRARVAYSNVFRIE